MPLALSWEGTIADDVQYNPIQKYAPQDCVGYINKIIDNFDMIREAGNRDAVAQFKSLFGLEALTDDRDFAMTVAFPIGGPMNYPTNTYGNTFHSENHLC